MERMLVFTSIRNAGEVGIGVRQLAEKLGIDRDKVNIHLAALEAAGFEVGENNTHLYSAVVEEK